MPVPTIIVYIDTPSTEDDAYIIQQFHKLSFSPMVDSTHINSYQYFINNFKKNYKYYIHSEDNIFEFDNLDLDEEMNFSPDFSISFNQDLDISDEMWRNILSYLKFHVTKFGHERNIDYTKVHAASKFLETPLSDVKALPENPEPPKPLPTHYEFRMQNIPQYDIQLYEIIKPHTDLPYTSVTRNFSTEGHLPFFSSLFIAESWGVDQADITFLFKLWKHLEMQGEYDPESLYKKRVEACYPSPSGIAEAEPEVYRRTLEQVTQQITENFDGKICVHREKRTRLIPRKILDNKV